MSDITYTEKISGVPFYTETGNPEHVKVILGMFEVHFVLTAGTRGEDDARYSLHIVDPTGAGDHFDADDLTGDELYGMLETLAFVSVAS